MRPRFGYFSASAASAPPRVAAKFPKSSAPLGYAGNSHPIALSISQVRRTAERIIIRR
jgi:hypothetical protein